MSVMSAFGSPFGDVNLVDESRWSAMLALQKRCGAERVVEWRPPRGRIRIVGTNSGRRRITRGVSGDRCEAATIDGHALQESAADRGERTGGAGAGAL